MSYLLDQKTVHRPGVYRRYLRRGQWPHRHPPSGRHPAHLGKSVVSTIPEPSMWGEISRESGYALAKKAVEEHTLAEAVLLGSDEVAEGALEAFRELGVPCAERCGGHHLSGYSDLGEQVAHRHPAWRCFPDYVWENALELLFWPDQSASFPGSDRHGAHPPEDWRHSLNH